MRVVFSMDLTWTRSLADMGELASFMGLKLRTAFMILFEVLGRVRTRGDRQFRVASTINASLYSTTEVSREPRCHCHLYLPAVVLQDSQHAIEQTHRLRLHGSRV